MRTTEVHEIQTDELSTLSEEIGAKLAQARQASGLSQWEFANTLGIPVCYTEILENGILVLDDDYHYTKWKGIPFTKDELSRVSQQLSKGITTHGNDHHLGSETVFFCPITISRSSIIDEIHSIAGQKDCTSSLIQHISYALSMKYRLSYRHLCVKQGKEAAESMKRRVFSVLSAYQKKH